MAVVMQVDHIAAYRYNLWHVLMVVFTRYSSQHVQADLLFVCVLKHQDGSALLVVEGHVRIGS